MPTKDPELALLEPGTEIIQCSICDELIWQHRADPISAKMALPTFPWPSGQTYGQALQLMMEAANDLYAETVTIPSEKACRDHMLEKHRLRLWLWERYGWDRVLRRWFW